jgi:hypothetical protein
MPLDHGYGVVVGTFVSFTRDDPDDFGHWYHGKLRVATPAGVYEAALDVDTPGGAGVSYRLVDRLSTASIPALHALPPGWTPLDPTPSSGALDYVRSPLLRDGWFVALLRRVAVRLRRPAPPRTPAQHAAAIAAGAVSAATPVPGTAPPSAASRSWAPGPLDAVLRLLRPLLRQRSYPWVGSNGDNALNVLEPMAREAVRIYVFGEPFTSGRGVHNVHMNQGDPPGPHQAENGIWQDGAVMCESVTGAVRIWQIKFNPQSLHTDGSGLPI